MAKTKGNPGDGNSKTARIVRILCGLCILVCTLILSIECFRDWQQKRQSESLWELAKVKTTVAERLPRLTELEEMEHPYVSPIDFEVLRKVNQDVIAWLNIPGTSIDYPVIQGTDNEKYLSMSFEGEKSAAGAIFLDYESDEDLLGRHSIFYGHHMKNKTMFADIVKFREEEFFKEHREIILYTPERELHLTTVAALYGDSSGEKRRTKFSTEEEFLTYVDEMTGGCTFRDIPEGEIRHLYSFATCSYEFEDARTILYAVLQ